MEFKKHQSIYLQIEDMICEHILTKKWKEGERIQSVRELAASIEVNPNTVMRAYSKLQDTGIIQNKRGIGYFVSTGAPERIAGLQKEAFVVEELPAVFKKMKILGITLEELGKLFKKYLSDSK